MASDHIPILVINLNSESARRRSIVRQCEQGGLNPRMVQAYDGHNVRFPFYRYKELSGRFWSDESSFKPGAFCCYLSHAECWRLIANGKAEHGLILEDDVELNTEEMRKFSLQRIADFDIIFVNSRTSRYVRRSPSTQEFVELGPLIFNIIQKGTFAGKLPSPGGDGYVVSKSGAEALLRIMNTRGICMGVDYAMALHSLDQNQLEQLSLMEGSALPNSVRCLLANHARMQYEPIKLKAYVHNGPSLVRTGSFNSSIRHDVWLSNSLFDLRPGAFRRWADILKQGYWQSRRPAV